MASKDCIEKRLAVEPTYKNKLSEMVWESDIKNDYKITAIDYYRMLASQNGGCRICGKKTIKRLSVDHDHKTGRVRGLLCVTCNFVLGHAKDDVALLRKAIEYLERN
jgi:hypothetical protein